MWPEDKPASNGESTNSEPPDLGQGLDRVELTRPEETQETHKTGGVGGIGGTWDVLRELVLKARDGDTAAAQLELEKQSLVRQLVPTGPYPAPPRMREYMTRRANTMLERTLSQVKSNTSAQDLTRQVETIRQELQREYDDATWDLPRIVLMNNWNCQAARELILKYEEKIRRMAGKFSRMCPERAEDFVQAGLVYFTLNALKQYDPLHGTPLWTFARRHTRHAIRDEFIKCHEKSRRQSDMEQLVRLTLIELSQELDNEPTAEQVASETGLEVDVVRRLLADVRSPNRISIDAEWQRQDGDTSSLLMKLPVSSSDYQSRLSQQDTYRTIIEFLNDQEPDSKAWPGEKWVVLYVLNDRATEGVSWEEVSQLLAQREPGLLAWPDICEHYALPSGFERGWGHIHSMFSVPPPKLTWNALRSWYHHRLTRMLDDPYLLNRLMHPH